MQLKMLKEHSKKRTADIKLGRKGEERTTYIAFLDKMEVFGDRLDRASEMMMKMTTEWNTDKAILDKHSLMHGDCNVKKFAAALKRMEKLYHKNKEMRTLATKVKQTSDHWVMDEPLKNDLLNQVDFMRRVHKNSPKELKNMKRTPEQREGNRQRSISMSMRWGM